MSILIPKHIILRFDELTLEWENKLRDRVLLVRGDDGKETKILPGRSKAFLTKRIRVSYITRTSSIERLLYDDIPLEGEYRYGLKNGKNLAFYPTSNTTLKYFLTEISKYKNM